MNSKKKASKAIIYSTVTGWLFQVVSAVSGFIILPIVVSNLGKAEYGIWILVIQSVQFLSMSDLGVANALGRFIARAVGAKDEVVMEKLYSTTMVFLLGSGLLIALITFILSPYIGWLLGIEESYYHVTKIIFLVTGLSIAFQMPLKLSTGVLTGRQLYGPNGIGKILGSILNISGVGVLYFINKIDLIPLAVVSAFSFSFSQVVLAVYARRITGPWHLSFKNISFDLMKDILSLSTANLQITFGNYIYRSGMVIAVGRILGTQAAGVYGVALTFISHIYPLILSFSNPIGTLASEFEAGGKVEDIKKISLSIMKIIFSLSACAAAGLFVYAEPILNFMIRNSNWVYADYKSAAGMMFIMGICFAIGLPQEVSARVLKGVGKHWHVSNTCFLFSICALLSGIIIMHATGSIYGAAIGWGVFWLMQGILLYPRMLSKFIGVPISSMIIKSYFPGIVIGTIILLLSMLLTKIMGNVKAINIILEITICALIGIGMIIYSSGLRRKGIKDIFKKRN